MDCAKLGELVVQAQQGDSAALSELYQQTYNSSYFYALKVMGSEHDALDVMQSAYIIMVEKIGTIKEPQTFFHWIRRVLTNECNRALGKKSKTVLADDEGQDLFENIEDERTEFLPADVLDDKEKQRIIFDALKHELSSMQKQTVLLFYYDELKLSEIAEITGANENAVKNRLFESRRKLKAALEKYRKQGVLAVVPLPLFTKLLKQAAEQSRLSPELAGNLLGNVSNATGVSLTYTAPAADAAVSAGTEMTLKTAVMSSKAKIIAGIAAVLVMGGIAAAVLILSSRNYTSPAQGNLESTISSSITTSSDMDAPSATEESSAAQSTAETNPTQTAPSSTVSTTEAPTTSKPITDKVNIYTDIHHVKYYDGWVYYLKGKIEDFDEVFLYRMRPDGSGSQLLNGVDLTYEFFIQDGWIYFTQGLPQDESLYKMRTDGGGKQLLLGNWGRYAKYYNGWIYYEYGSELNRIKPDGTGNAVIDGISMGVNGFYIQDNAVYYADLDNDFALTKINLDGTGKQKLCDYGYPVTVAGNIIYYMAKDEKTYQIRTDSSGNQLMPGVYNLIENNGWLYYSTGSSGGAESIYKMRTDGTQKTLLYTVTAGSSVTGLHTGDGAVYAGVKTN